MKTARFFWFYFKRYRFSFTVIAVAVILATYFTSKSSCLLRRVLD